MRLQTSLLLVVLLATTVADKVGSAEPVDLSCQRDNTNFRGADMTHYISAGIEACANRCKDTPGCKAVSLRKSDNDCWLKHKEGGEAGPNPDNNVISMNMDCDNEPVDMSCQRYNTDFWGADLRDFKTTGFEACANFCRDAYNCNAITFITQEEYQPITNFSRNVRKRCYLKYRQGGEKGPIHKKNRDSMNLDCDNTPVDMSCIRYNTEFWGADLRDFLCGGVYACANYCKDTYNCKAITYNTYENWCYLKYKQGGEYGPNPKTGLISMNMDCDNERVDMSCQRDNTEYEGYDLREFESSGFEACANFCRDSEDCRSFAFGKYSRWCRLKDKKFDIWRIKENVNMKSMNVPC